MSNFKLLYKILRLKGLKITDYWFKNRNKGLHLSIKPFKNGCRCPVCDRRGKIVVTSTALRCWEDITLMGLKVFFWYAPKEIYCPTHGRIQEEIPWADAYARITYRLEWRICSLCQIMTQKAASEILAMPASTLSDLLHRIITKTREGHKIRGLVTLGVDEISFLKGRKFVTIVYDLDRSKVLWVGQGKGRKTIDKFFDNALSYYQKSRILWASCDMSLAYTEAIKHHCPNATLVIDRFHVVKAMNEAVDEVRKEQWREMDPEGRKSIKGLRWLLAMHSTNRTKGNTRFLNNLRKGNRRIHRAWVLKDEFEHIWTYKNKGCAEKFLKKWITTALRTRIPSLKTFALTMRKHFDNIAAFTDRNLTNAVGEGLNRVIKIVKNRASGYRNLDCFSDMIFLTVGNLDIPAQIPSNLRTL